MFGSVPAAVGVESTSSYTGIGFNEFSRTLCLNHNGSSCAAAFPALWEAAGSAVGVERLVDALKTRTVVVQNALVPEAAAWSAPTGWLTAAVTDRVTVFERVGDVAWPDSRLAAVTPGVHVSEAIGTDTTEHLRVDTGSRPGAVQFARLAWPGYEASVGGQSLVVRRNAQGLVELELPAGLTDASVALRFSPPGYDVGVPLLLAGAGLALVQSIAFAVGGATRPRRAA